MPLLETRASGSILGYGFNSFLTRPPVVTSGLQVYVDSTISASYGGQNLLLRSEAPATTPWSKYGGTAVTVTNNAATDPLGGFTAATVTQVGGVGGESIIQNVSVPGNETYLLSVYIKAPTTNAAPNFTLAAFLTGAGTVGNSTAWNPLNGSYVGGDTNGTVEEVGDGWRRYTVRMVGTNPGNNNLVWQIYTSVGTIQVWGAQLRRVSQNPTEGYVRTTTSQFTASPTIWYDLSGNGINFTSTGSTVTTDFGPRGWRFNEDESKYMQTSTGITVGTSFTYEFIHYNNGDNGSIPLMTGFHLNDARETINLDFNGTNVIYLGSDFTSWPTFQMPLNYNQYKFIYVQVTVSNGTANAWFSTREGGPLKRLVTNATIPANQGQANTRFYMGRYSNFNGYALNGSIYNFKFYNRALSEAEIIQNFNAVRSVYGL